MSIKEQVAGGGAVVSRDGCAIRIDDYTQGILGAKSERLANLSDG